MTERPIDDRIVQESQVTIDRAQKAAEMAKRDERRERMQSLERVLSHQPSTDEDSD